MAAEKVLRANVLKILKKAGLDAHPVENPVHPGFPDVEFIGGTMELKKVDNWPARPDTPLRLDHYTQGQRVWHTRRWTKGGNVTVLVQVSVEYLLFAGDVAATVLGHTNQRELRAHALAIFSDLSGLRSGLVAAIEEAR